MLTLPTTEAGGFTAVLDKMKVLSMGRPRKVNDCKEKPSQKLPKGLSHFRLRTEVR